MDEGYKKGERQIEQAKSDAEKEYARLKGEFERASLNLKRNKMYLQYLEAELARGFDT